MISCLVALILGFIAGTLYYRSKAKEISPNSKRILEVWTLVLGLCIGIMLCSALMTGV